MADAWKNWVESVIVNPSDSARCCDRSGIYGLDGNPWAQTTDLNVSLVSIILSLN